MARKSGKRTQLDAAEIRYWLSIYYAKSLQHMRIMPEQIATMTLSEKETAILADVRHNTHITARTQYGLSDESATLEVEIAQKRYADPTYQAPAAIENVSLQTLINRHYSKQMTKCMAYCDSIEEAAAECFETTFYGHYVLGIAADDLPAMMQIAHENYVAAKTKRDATKAAKEVTAVAQIKPIKAQSSTNNIYANLPKIMYVVSIDDAGEFGAADCPHCGALGRYVYWFMLEDGTLHGAMAGCFKKFERHEFADRWAELLTKQKHAQEKGRKLASWDADVLDALYKFQDNGLSEQQVRGVMQQADARKRAWMQKQGYR